MDHFFRDTVMPSIIFDIEPEDVAHVLTLYLDEISTGHQRGGWPSFFASEMSEMVTKISDADCTMSTIQSSCGIDGWVLARSMQIEPRNAG